MVRCAICGEELDERGMQEHDHEVPPVVQGAGSGFPCPTCGRQFDSEEDLVEHAALGHEAGSGPPPA